MVERLTYSKGSSAVTEAANLGWGDHRRGNHRRRQSAHSFFLHAQQGANTVALPSGVDSIVSIDVDHALGCARRERSTLERVAVVRTLHGALAIVRWVVGDLRVGSTCAAAVKSLLDELLIVGQLDDTSCDDGVHLGPGQGCPR
jgi:hypothetical protein